MRILLFGSASLGSLEHSFKTAFEQIGHTVLLIDINTVIGEYVRGGEIGKRCFRFLPVEPWAAKGVRKLVVLTGEFRPDIIVVFGAGAIRAGGLAQMRANFPRVLIVLYWPDPLLRVEAHVWPCINLYDCIYSFSRAQVPVWERSGARKAVWLPLAFDPELHVQQAPLEDIAKEKIIGFIGSHRPEREHIFELIHSAGIPVMIWGDTSWIRHVKNRRLFKKLWQGGPLYGKQYASAVGRLHAVVNPVDRTTPGAANMRYFETMGLGGLLINEGGCEMETEFPHEKCCYYYFREADIVDVLIKSLGSLQECAKMRNEARDNIHRAHTYRNRANAMIESLSVG